MKFGVIGGDMRQIYLAKSIEKDGHEVLVSGFEKLENKEKMQMTSRTKLIKNSDIIIMPLPVCRKEILNAPYANTNIILNDAFAKEFEDMKIYGGVTIPLKKTSVFWNDADIYDYYEKEELLLGNAMLTAEGAMAAVIKEFPGSLNGAKCLVTGFGRIGKALCQYLRGFFADVSCAARKDADLMGIHTIGCKALRYGEIAESYDLIFNTVPYIVLSEKILDKQSTETIIIELASSPGGVDLEYASQKGVRVVQAQSIPGVYSPRTAGEYIKETIYNMMEES